MDACDENFYEMSYFLRDISKSKKTLKADYILFDGNDMYYLEYCSAHLQFYMNILKEKGININFKDYRDLDTGNKVMTSDSNIKKYLLKHYNYSIINMDGNIEAYLIKGKI